MIRNARKKVDLVAIGLWGLAGLAVANVVRSLPLEPRAPWVYRNYTVTLTPTFVGTYNWVVTDALGNEIHREHAWTTALAEREAKAYIDWYVDIEREMVR
jgi:hypothetical protein